MIEDREERIMVRVAICDDDKNFAGGLETLVMEEAEIMGVQIETEVFFDGKPLLKELERGTRYDLMFLDIEMEHINGIEVARSIRGMDKTVLLIQGNSYDNSAQFLRRKKRTGAGWTFWDDKEECMESRTWSLVGRAGG